MDTNSSSMSDSQFEELFAKYLAASERGDQREMEDLLAIHPWFETRISALGEFDSLLKALLAGKSKNSNDLLPPDAADFDQERSTDSQSFPRAFGDFELTGFVGDGGMGIVYRAKQLRLGNRIVALKVSRFVQEAQSGSSLTDHRFQTEIHVAGKLDHPHIVPVFESGQYDGRNFIAMKLIDGSNLKSLPCESQRIEVRRLIHVADAVQHAHDRGILHRDLKPSNIIVDGSGVPFVTDFGLAKLIDPSQSVTQTGVSIGTPQYMSPEQADGHLSLTVASDIYSLGVILFERVCGKPLYEWTTLTDVVNKVRFGARPNIRLTNTKCDRDLRAIILKCLELHPSDRYESCRSLAHDLEKWLCGEPIDSRPVGKGLRALRWMRLHPLKTMVVSAMALGVLSVIVLSFANLQNQWKYEITEYSRHIQIVRAELSERRVGWKERAYQSLEAAKTSSYASGNANELASMRANCDIGFDIGKPLYTIQQSNTVAVKFHPTKPLLFLARKYAEDNETRCPILVVDAKSGQTIEKLMVSQAVADKRSAIRDIAILPKSESIVVLTGSPSLEVYSISPDSFGRLIYSQPVDLVNPSLQEIEGEELLTLAGVNHRGIWQLSSLNTEAWETVATKELPDGFISMTQHFDQHRLITCEPNRLVVRDPRRFEPTSAQIPIEFTGNAAYFYDQIAVASQYGVDLFSIPSAVKTHHLWSNPSRNSSLDSMRNTMCCSSFGAFIAASDNERHQVSLWNAFDRTFLQTIYLKDAMYRTISMDMSRDGLLAVFAGNETAVYAAKQPSTKLVASASSPMGRISLASKRSEFYSMTLLADRPHGGDLRRHSFVQGTSSELGRTLISRTPLDRSLKLILSLDERYVATASATPEFRTQIRVLDASTLESLGDSCPVERLGNIVFDSTGRLFATVKGGLASFSRDYTEIDLHWIRPQVEGALVGSANYPVLERLDDSQFIIGDEDGWLIKLLWTSSPKATQAIRLGDSPLWSSALSKDGSVLALGDGNGELFVVDPKSCRLLQRLPNAHATRIASLTWTESGCLISAGLDRALNVWAWNGKENRLQNILTLQFRSSVLQVVPVKSESNGELLFILREGSNAIESLTVALP